MTNPVFVSTQWLADNLDQPDVVVLDASWYLPAQQRDAVAEYAAGHILASFIVFFADTRYGFDRAFDESYYLTDRYIFWVARKRKTTVYAAFRFNKIPLS